MDLVEGIMFVGRIVLKDWWVWKLGNKGWKLISKWGSVGCFFKVVDWIMRERW